MMRGTVPGFIGEIEEGTEVIYVEASDQENFRLLVDGAIESRPGNTPLPSGGVLEEKTRVRLPDGTWLLGMSYRGDLPGWRELIVSFCKRNEKKWAFPRGEALAVSDGHETPLMYCDVLYEAPRKKDTRKVC
jgi:hypothetical protein